MTKSPERMVRELVSDPRGTLAEPQHREALYLVANTLALAVGGLLFWLVLTRGLSVPSEVVGKGYAVVSLGTAVGVVAKSGFDTAMLRHGPRASRSSATDMLHLSVMLGVALTVLLTLVTAGLGDAGVPLPSLPLAGWLLVAAIGSLLLVTWMLDAYFVSDREARFALARNLTFSGVRLLAPLLLILVATPFLVASAWAAGLAFSALVGAVLATRLPDRDGDDVDRGPFLRTTVRNVASSAAEFLPGLLLVPIVLAIAGPRSAAHFGIAWTVAHLLFQIASAISRSALVEFSDAPASRHPGAVRRGILQAAVILAPAAVGAALFAPHVLGVFGAEYAAFGSTAFVVLCASIVVVAPWNLYLAVLRAREQVVPLVAFPVVTVAALFALVPLMESWWGLPGVSVAWIAANAPFGAWSTWRLYQEGQEVASDDTPPVDGHPDPG